MVVESVDPSVSCCFLAFPTNRFLVLPEAVTSGDGVSAGTDDIDAGSIGRMLTVLSVPKVYSKKNAQGARAFLFSLHRRVWQS